jgi:DnaJ like chaperone protein
MGRFLVTILVAAPMVAALIWLGLIGCAGFAGSRGSPRMLQLARCLNPKGLTKYLTPLCRFSGRGFAALAGKCRFACAVCWARLSPVVAGLKSHLSTAILNFKKLTIGPRLSVVIRRLRFPALRMRSTVFDLSERPGLSALAGAIQQVVFGKVDCDARAETYLTPDPAILNCRVRLVRDPKNGLASDVFAVEICGSVNAPGDDCEAILRAAILDVTDSARDPSPVHAKARQWQMGDSPAFCYSAELGKLTSRHTVLSDWTAVAQLRPEWLLFPRKGRRDLQFLASVSSRRDTQALAHAECTLSYDNSDLGYIDMEENSRRTKTLAVALAFTVSASDGRLFNCEVDVIKNWARDNVCLSQGSDKARRMLEKALSKTLAFFRDGNHLNTYEICKEIAEIAPLADRYDILDLCLRVAQAKGSAAPEELALLNDLTMWLEVDPDVFRGMAERILPVSMHQVKNTEAVLGVTSDMGKEKTRRHLNKEYSKWNARVTNSDPQIQAQADQMLSLIAEARRQYVG